MPISPSASIPDGAKLIPCAGAFRDTTAERSRSPPRRGTDQSLPAAPKLSELISSHFDSQPARQCATTTTTPATVTPAPTPEAPAEIGQDDEARIWEAQLPAAVRDRLKKLENEGVLRSGDLDAAALSTLFYLNRVMQDKALNYLETERVFLMNARSKSGFLTSACERARIGILDVRGVGGGVDPWRRAILATAVSRRTAVELVPEEAWLQRHGAEPTEIIVDVSADKAIGVAVVCLNLLLTRSVSDLKQRLRALGVLSIPLHKMRLKKSELGFLRDERSLAFYNLRSGSKLQLSCRMRAGRHGQGRPSGCDGSLVGADNR